MSNMSYCRFQNTAQDLSDCSDHILAGLGEEEARARLRLFHIALDMLEEIGVEVDLGDSTIEERLAKYSTDQVAE